MATVAFVAAAAAIPGLGPVAAAAVSAAAAVAGGYVDSLLLNELFPPDDVHGPRIDDAAIQRASEATPAVRNMGPTVRHEGQLLWVSDLIETQTQQSTGGKGGGGGSFIEYQYFAHAQVGVCRNQVSRFLKIWADGKLIYNVAPDFDVQGDTTLSCTPHSTEVAKWNGATFQYDQFFTYYLDIKSPNGGVDLRGLVSGKDVIVSGWANAVNNGTFRVHRTKANSDGSTEVRILLGDETVTTTGIAEIPGVAVSLFQSKPAFSPKTMDAIHFYDGSDSQLPDPIVESIEGVGNVPAYRGRAIVVFEKLALQDYGNRLPNLHFLVEVDGVLTLGDAIARVLTWAGLEPDEYEVSTLTESFPGFLVRGAQAPLSMLSVIMAGYDVVARQSGGRLEFYKRSAAPTYVVNENDLAAEPVGGGGGAPRNVRKEHAKEGNIPREVNVRFQDPERDYQTGGRRWRRIHGRGSSVSTLDLSNLVLDAADATCLAKRGLWTAAANARLLSFHLGPKYVDVTEGQLLTVPDGSSTWSALTRTVDRGENSLVEIAALSEEAQTLTQSCAADTPGGIPAPAELGSGTLSTQAHPPEIDFEVLDLPPLRDEHVTQPGVYVFATPADSGQNFQAATLYQSVDGGTKYEPVLRIVDAATMGYSTDALASAVHHYWDRGSTLNVSLTNGSLSSVTEVQCLNGANRALIGGEIIGFVNATLEADGTYTLDTLLRGLRGTEDATTHSAGEFFVHLNAPGVYFLPQNAASIGRKSYFRCAAPGATVSLLTTKAVTPAALNMTPFAPTHVSGARDASNDLAMTFRPRTRYITGAFQRAPLSERLDQWDVDVDDPGPSPLPVRNFLPVVPAQEYSAAEQTSDGYTPGDPVTVDVYARSEFVGRGKKATKTV